MATAMIGRIAVSVRALPGIVPVRIAMEDERNRDLQPTGPTVGRAVEWCRLYLAVYSPAIRIAVTPLEVGAVVPVLRSWNTPRS